MARVINSGRFTMGAETEAFEAELAAHLGRRHAIMVNSGSSANLVAVAACHLSTNKSWSEVESNNVFVPAIAWATTYAPFAQLKYEFVLADVDDTWNAVPTDLRGSPRRNLPAIIVSCPVLGNAANYLDWEEYPDRPLLVFEDACESLGAEADDGPCGTLGDVSTLSFFWSHQLSAIEGGAVVTDDDELARLCRLLRNHGNAGWGSEKFEEQYRFEIFGYNVRPLEMHAAIARAQLRKLSAMCHERRANAAHFRALTTGLPVVHQRLVGTPAPFGIAFEVDSRVHRYDLAVNLRAEGIDARLPTGGSFLRHPYGAPWRDQQTPRADRIHDCGMFLGCAPFPIPDLIERAVAVMRKVL